MKKPDMRIVISIVLFAALFAGTFLWGRTAEKTIHPQIVILGDSIFGEIRDETAIASILQEMTGMSLFNGAFGGSCVARIEENNRLDYPKDSLSLVGITRAIYADDFGVQQTGRYREPMTEYFGDVIDEFEKVNFDDVEIVLIQQGINDYHAGTPIDNPNDPYDEYTFLGALRTGIELLREVNPDMRIVLVTPSYSWYVVSWKTCAELDNGGGVLEEYVNAEIAFAEEMGVEVIDMYHDFIPTDSWDDCAVYTQDGVHPNEAGRKLWAERIAEALTK